VSTLCLGNCLRRISGEGNRQAEASAGMGRGKNGWWSVDGAKSRVRMAVELRKGGARCLAVCIGPTATATSASHLGVCVDFC
jgi:hypothetical protein